MTVEFLSQISNEGKDDNNGRVVASERFFEKLPGGKEKVLDEFEKQRCGAKSIQPRWNFPSNPRMLRRITLATTDSLCRKIRSLKFFAVFSS